MHKLEAILTEKKYKNPRKYQMICVVAISNNGIIGDGNDLIWHLPGDLLRVKKITMGCPLIMGRRTWASIGKALPGRASIVLTRDTSWSANGAIVVHNFLDAIIESKNWLINQQTEENRLILFGGGEIYSLGIDFCQEIELTRVFLEPEKGTKFPDIDWQDWNELNCEHHASGPNYPSYSYHRFRYNKLVRYV